MQLCDAKPIELKSKQHLLDLIHVLLAHEADAAEEYNNVIAAAGNHKEIVDILIEVRRDERNHMGRLLRCIELLEPKEAEEIVEDK